MDGVAGVAASAPFYVSDSWHSGKQVAAGVADGGGIGWCWVVAAAGHGYSTGEFNFVGRLGGNQLFFSLITSHCFIVHVFLSCLTKAIHLYLNFDMPLLFLSIIAKPYAKQYHLILPHSLFTYLHLSADVCHGTLMVSPVVA